MEEITRSTARAGTPATAERQQKCTESISRLITTSETSKTARCKKHQGNREQQEGSKLDSI
jgi:hypothetical protein